MAKFYGQIGYGESVEARPGIWEDEITEQTYFGDVNRNMQRQTAGEGLNDDLRIDNSISIVADQYAIEHFHLIKYVRWEGVVWKVSSVERRAPRLILSLGGVWNGPVADPESP